MSNLWSPSWITQLVVLGLSLSVVSCATGDEVDYSEQLRPVPALSPNEALKTFHVAEGFRVELAAAEPNVVDPVAMAFDADGRLFVIEMRGYSEDDGQVLGRVRLLEDKDDDGQYETSSVFAEGLSWPTAITCTFDGVLVGAAPDLIFLKDHDGDGKADERRVVFTGFRKSNVQGLLNTFKWGLDNRIHGVTSSSGASVQKVDKNKPTGESISLSGRDFAIDPLSMTLSPTSGGGQHGMSFDAWGNKFTCSNSDHLQQVVYDDHYMARNPYVSPPSARRSIAEDGPQAEVYRTSPVEAWRVIRTRLRAAKIVPGVVEGGGRAAGYFTGATGVTIFRGDGWPAEASGLAIIGDVGSNLVHRKRLVDKGLLFRGVRIDEKSELLSSSDIWFRPVQYANAPDGSLYVADMYREVIEHPKSLPPMIKKHLDLTSGRDRGRIYRIVGDQFTRRPTPRLNSMTTEQLVALLDHPNGWHRETASRLIFERQDKSVTPQLSELVLKADSAEGQMHALYALQGLDSLTTETLLTALSDTNPRVQQHAIRLSEPLIPHSAALREQIGQLVDSPDPRVRFQLAFSIGAFPISEKTALLAKLVDSDGDDPYFRAAIQSSANEGAGQLLRELATDSKHIPTEMLSQLASQIGKQQSAADIATVLQLLEQLQETDSATFEKLVTAFHAKPGSKLSQQLAVVTRGESNQVIATMVQDAIAVLEDEEASVPAKTDAVALLRFQPFDADRFDTLLQPSQSIELQREALQVMSQFDEPEVAQLLLDNWQGIGPGLRASALDVVVSRPVWVGLLLDAIDSKKLPVAEVNVARLVELKPILPESQQKKIAALETLGENSDRVAVVDSYRSALTLDGNAIRGEKLFVQHCSACHHLSGKGHPIGPNLAAMKNRGAEAILVNVLRPNMEVNPQYMNYICLTSDGRTISGMIANETATTITLVQADNKTETILRLDIEQLRSTGVSLMPEGLEKVIDTQSMADLLEYLTQQ
ncbi:PVC-type heme-binding CxxCH protein [Bremerella sp. JC770]|uniref:PVC-type heme-binding CxxCH protein n=1 Tax=Bremerella sp. JC770 TaxID=3232137 RepID=UPI00345B1AE9